MSVEELLYYAEIWAWLTGHRPVFGGKETVLLSLSFPIPKVTKPPEIPWT